MKCTKVCMSAALLLLGMLRIPAQEKLDAHQLWRQGKYREAITVCEGELAVNPHNVDSHVVLIWSLVDNGQYAEAEQRGNTARKTVGDDTRIIEALAEAKYFLSKNNESLELFQKYISAVPLTASRVGAAYYYMGQIFIRQQRFQHADIAFSAAVQIEPQRDRWWTRLGYAREQGSDYELALEAYDRAISLNPTQTEAVRGRERCIERIN